MEETENVKWCVFKVPQYSNIQLHIKMITLLVLKQSTFKVNVNFEILCFPLKLMFTLSKKKDSLISLCVKMVGIRKQQITENYCKHVYYIT